MSVTRGKVATSSVMSLYCHRNRGGWLCLAVVSTGPSGSAVIAIMIAITAAMAVPKTGAKNASPESIPPPLNRVGIKLPHKQLSPHTSARVRPCTMLPWPCRLSSVSSASPTCGATATVRSSSKNSMVLILSTNWNEQEQLSG